MVLLLSAFAPLVLPAFAWQAPAAKKTAGKTPPKPAGDTIPDGPALSLDFILKMLSQVKADITDEPRIMAFIHKRGLDFDGTTRNLDRLRSAGASAELLRTISALKPPPAPPPPPPPPLITGVLQLYCAPAECSVRLDNGSEWKTRKGILSVDNLPLKDYTVDFTKDGYTPKSERVRVTAAANPPIRVTLEATRETRAGWGRELFRAMVRSINIQSGGAQAGITDLKTLSASGSASSWDLNGALSEWGMKAVFTPGATSYDLGNAASGSFTVACVGDTCPQKGKSSFGRKKVSGAEAASLNTNLVQFNRYHLVALLERIAGQDHRMFANAPPDAEGAEAHLLVESTEESFDIALDSAMLPSLVLYQSRDGLATVKVTYALWTNLSSGSRYPRHTSVALPGEKQHGIHVRFETVTAGAK